MIDSPRSNEATGFPHHEVTQTPRLGGSVERIARGKFGPFPSEWEEFPWEWVEQHKMRNIRRFRKSIFDKITALFELAPEGYGCHMHAEFSMESSNLFGTLFLLFGGGTNLAGKVETFIAANVSNVPDNGPLPAALAGDKVSPAVRSRLTQLVAEIEGGTYHNLARLLAEFIATGSDVDMNRIRPLELAQKWDTEPRKTIELCLETVRVGILGMRWNLICPRCRSGEGALPDLAALPEGHPLSVLQHRLST